MTLNHHTLTYLPLDQIKVNPSNPRKHSHAQVRALARSIEAFGFNAPVLVDGKKMLIAGHGRLEAARMLKMPQVPVIALDDLNEHQAKAYMLADNKLTDRSSWNEPLLAAHLKELSELSTDFEIEATGFEAPEIDLRILSLDESDVDDEDEFEVAAGPAVTRSGDVWFLDDHILCCGDSLEPASYECFPAGTKAAMVFADAPYNIPINGHVSGLGRIKHREFAQASGEMSVQAFTDFLSRAMSQAAQFSAVGALHFWCMDWRHVQEVLTAGVASAMEHLNLCVWAKTNGGMGGLYRSRHELVFVFRNGSTPHTNNVQLGRFGRNRTNVWNYPGANVPSGGKALKYHPTPKPVALVADAILDCTVRGEGVLDPFLGSGTTLLACHRTGRRLFGIELDPLYVDTAVERWQKKTGRNARLPGGQSFAEAKSSRGAE